MNFKQAVQEDGLNEVGISVQINMSTESIHHWNIERLKPVA